LPLREDQIIKGLKVRLSGNAMKQGFLTGRTQQLRTKIIAEVDFGPADKSYKRISLLEPVLDNESPAELVSSGRFGSLKDFRARLTAEKVGGDLTDIFYSLGQDRTDFYPHQFLPVMKFIQTMPGRLLIADEVGLGKTIEAAYIWKEIEARHDAYSWLIICPSVLKDKWKSDLSRLFRIDARIVNGKELYDELQAISNGDRYKERVLIAGLEGIRIHKGLTFFLENNTEAEDPLLDLITVDEAHYLRNASTKSHQIVESLRFAAEHLLLLSATPIQTEARNLFNLLKLLEPEEFFDPESFNEQNSQNRYIVDGIRWLIEGVDIEKIGEHLDKALNLSFFKGNALLEEILIELADLHSADKETRYLFADELEKVSMFHRHINRTLKRDVMKNRVVREARRVSVVFNSHEENLYNQVTSRLKTQGKLANNMNVFALMTRQRQMASSLPAAIRSWIRKEHEIDEKEQIWEDFGNFENVDDTETLYVPNVGAISESDYQVLRNNDSKYSALKNILNEIIGKEPEAKIVLFSFFRETLAYLQERLTEDDITNRLLRGGVKDKTYVIDEFKSNKSTRILLSSEVGSEGVDLQFCRVVINFDLPWNPMRVEQRIGRIDRIGQKAEKIHIYNLVREDSIEERILERLLNRIGLFQGSIGDLEDIIGDQIFNLAVDLFNPDLTEEQQQKRADQTIDAIGRRRQIQNDLEREAWQLSGLGDYLLHRIEEKKELGHWIRPKDLELLVTDYLGSRYPGTHMESGKLKQQIRVELSTDASSDLQLFMNQNKVATTTALIRKNAVTLDFDPHRDMPGYGREPITVRHPLVRWISRSVLETHTESPTVLVAIPQTGVDLQQGFYTFAIAFFGLSGVFRKRELFYSIVNLESGKEIDGKDAERIIQKALQNGRPHRSGIPYKLEIKIDDALNIMNRNLTSRFEDFDEASVARNNANAEQQELLIRKRSEREISSIQEVIDRLIIEGKERTLPAQRGRIRKIEIWRETQLKRVMRNKVADSEYRDVAAGIIAVTEEI